MKILMKLIRDCQSMDVSAQLGAFESAFQPDKAAEEFNSLVLALSVTDPYLGYAGKLSAYCLHCKSKHDPTADMENIKAHHKESCVWLQSRELAELCKAAPKQS